MGKQETLLPPASLASLLRRISNVPSSCHVPPKPPWHVLRASSPDAVMIGSPFASTVGAPGRGYHWGMATPHAELPRGVRVHVGQTHTVEQLLFGPTSKTDGTENLVGALKTSMSTCGAQTVKDFHDARMVIAPSIKTEGKIYQLAQTRPAGI